MPGIGELCELFLEKSYIFKYRLTTECHGYKTRLSCFVGHPGQWTFSNLFIGTPWTFSNLFIGTPCTFSNLFRSDTDVPVFKNRDFSTIPGNTFFFVNNFVFCIFFLLIS